MKLTQSHYAGCTSWNSWRLLRSAICLTLVAALLPVTGCEKPGDAPRESTAPTPEAATEPPASPAATSAPERNADAPATPRGTAKPTESPRADRTQTTTSAKPATGAARRTASPISQADQQHVAKLSADAGLPDPPDLTKLTPDVAMHLRSTIEQAAADPSAENIGGLGCLYFDIMRTRDDTERAVVCFERARELDPESYVWPHLMGRVFIRRLSYVRARMEFDKSAELNPDYPDNYAWAADVAWRTQDVDASAELYARFIELAPDEPSGYAGLAIAELNRGETESAYEHLQKGLSLDPGNRRIHAVLAQYHHKTGNAARAARHKGFADSMKQTRVTQNDPINMLLLRAAGPTSIAIERIQALARSGSSDIANALRDDLLRDYPNNTLLLTGAAETSLMTGGIDEAFGYVRKALAIEPDFARALVLLADCHLAQGQAEDAIAQADHALAVNPDLSAAHIAKARALRMLERHDEALAAFMEAIKREPDNIQLKTTAGEIMRGLGKLDEAKEWCGKLVRGAEADGTVTAVYAPAYMTLASIARAQDDASGAVENLKRSILTDPTREPIFRQLASLLIELGRGDDALALAKRLMEGQPHLINYAITYGNLLSATGRRDQAIAHLEKLSGEVPHHPAPHMALATILLQQNQLDEAEEHLRKVIELQETHEGAHLLLLDIARRRKDTDAAFAVVERAVEKVPNSELLANSIAWMLATTPDKKYRDPKRAVDVAENMVARTNRRVPNYLDTLACAYAAEGRFDDAIRTEKEALQIAERAKQPNLVAEYEERIQLFERNEAYIERD